MEIFIDTAGANKTEATTETHGSGSTTAPSLRVWRHFDPGERSRACRICRIEKPLEQFEKTSPHNGRVYRRRICRECRKPSLRTLQKRWGRDHRERRLQTWRNYNMRRFVKNRGIPEESFHTIIEAEFNGACPLHRLHPDYYYPGKFIEVKRASTRKEYPWTDISVHFPNLFFRNGRKSVDEQIALYPKPLLVTVFDKQTGVELCRKEFV